LPELDDSSEDPDAALAINNCLNEVRNGVDISPQEWSVWFDCPREDVDTVFRKWAGMRSRMYITGIQ
jgi:hypothetical protein